MSRDTTNKTSVSVAVEIGMLLASKGIINLDIDDPNDHSWRSLKLAISHIQSYLVNTGLIDDNEDCPPYQDGQFFDFRLHRQCTRENELTKARMKGKTFDEYLQFMAQLEEKKTDQPR